MGAFRFYCRGCKKSFSTDSVNRKRFKGKKKKTMIAHTARCPKCGHEAHRIMGRAK
jgi:RNase P subunit RPR2